MNKEYYNYIYLDPRKPGKYTYNDLNFCLLYEPFYVGKGKDKRYLAHINEAKKQKSKTKNSYKINKIIKILELNYNLEDYILRLNVADIEKETLDYEIKLIEEIGLKNLTNMTPGGEGVSGRVTCIDKDGTPFSVTMLEYSIRNDLIHINKNRKQSKETIKSRVLKNTGKKRSKETKKKMSESSKGKINCKDKDGNTFCVTKEEFDNNPELVHITKNLVPCIDILTNTKTSVTKEEFYSNENLKGVQIGKKRSKETKKKMSELNKGKNNPNAKSITIYNEKDELMFKCWGDFKKVCKDNNLPLCYLEKCYRDNIKIDYHINEKYKTKVTNNGNIKYQGWYAIKIVH